jgi:hypothetical protein
MKKLFLIIALLALYLSGNSQIFNGGLLLGFTASQVDGDSYSGYDKPGIHGGVFISTGIFPHMDARMEIRYASRGAKNPASDDNTGFYLLGLHYIDIPVVVSYKIKRYGAAELGLVPGYLISVNGEDDGGQLPEDALVDYHKFDLGLLLGLNINLLPKLSLCMRYTYSVFSIRDLESAGAYYSWFGKIFGHSVGDFNNYLTFGINYTLR